MSDRNDQESRWSSVREREERDRQRQAQREAARQARLAREEAAADGARSDPGQRRLTDEERRTIREYRFPSASTPRDGTQNATLPPPPAAEATASSLSTNRGTTSGAGTKWRDSIASTAPATTGLPDLPGDGNGGNGKRPGNARLLVFGAGLLAVMAAVAFLPFGPFGGEDEPSIPTPSATLPTILGPDADTADDGSDPAEAVDQPVAGADQPIVCIDPGHGGWDPGWVRSADEVASMGPYNPPFATEAELNLGMSYMLKEVLEDEGMFVVLTRPSGAAVNMFDEDINDDGETRLEANNTEQAGARDELQARIYACNEAEADVLISVHINGYDDPAANGYEVYYTAEREFGNQNEELANLIYRRMDSALRDTEMGGKGRGAIPDNRLENERHEFGTAEHLIMTGPAVEIASIDPSQMPGVIVEAAFLSNDEEAAWIVQPANQRLVVQAYAAGIMDYFEQYPPQ